MDIIKKLNFSNNTRQILNIILKFKAKNGLKIITNSNKYSFPWNTTANTNLSTWTIYNSHQTTTNNKNSNKTLKSFHLKTELKIIKILS